MSNPFLKLLADAAAKAQQTFDLDPEKTQKVLQKTETLLEKGRQKIEDVEKATQAWEHDVAKRLKKAKDAFLEPTQPNNVYPSENDSQTDTSDPSKNDKADSLSPTNVAQNIKKKASSRQSSTKVASTTKIKSS